MSGVTLIIIFSVFSIRFAAATVGRRKLREAQQHYAQALDFLKESPADPELRQQTLKYGRAYAAVSRVSKRIGAFDEVALLNDINAVCAAASAAASSPASTVSTRQKLAELDELLDSRMISREEHAEIRAGVLRGIAMTSVQ